MQLKRYEAACVLLFVVFVSFTFGYFVGKGSVDGTIVINTQNGVDGIMLAPGNGNASDTGSDGQTYDDANSENSQEPFSDSDSINSAVQEEPPQSENSSADTSKTQGGLININTASAEELKTLPGIGDVLSQRIIDYRQTNGPFSSKEAITNVSGIGEKTYAKICDLITT